MSDGEAKEYGRLKVYSMLYPVSGKKTYVDVYIASDVQRILEHDQELILTQKDEIAKLKETVNKLRQKLN